jgi:LPS-assembly protein
VLLSSRLLGVVSFFLCLFVVNGAAQKVQSEEQTGTQSPISVSVPLGGDLVTIQAEEQTKTGKHDFRAKGKVEVQYRDLLLKADEVWGNDETQDVEGEGNVFFKQGEQEVYGKRFSFNLWSKTGIFYEVKGKANPGFFFEASEVEKLSEDKYRIKDGFVTACPDKVPKWSFTVRDAVFRVDQRVNMRHVFFRIKKVPIFFSPYLVAPVTETKRETGFLIPSTGNSTQKGRSISQPFFLTLGRSADLLATVEYFSLRGPAEDFRFEARPGEHSRIYSETFVVKDRLGQGGQSIRIIADNQFQNGFRGVANVDEASSRVFRQVWGSSFATIVRPDQVSSGFLTRNFSTYSLNLFGEERTTFYPRQNVNIRTLPSFDLFGHSRQIKDWPVYFSFDTAVDGLNRSDASLSTPPIVQRFDLYPRITIPLRNFNGISFTPSLGLRETFYSDSAAPISPTGVVSTNLLRSAFDFQGQLSWVGLERIFEVGSKMYKHVVTPDVTYRYITGIDQFAEIIRFDERDTMSNTNEVEYALDNRFFSRRSASDGSTVTNEFLSIRIAQKYFFDPTFGGALIPGQRNVFYPLDMLTAFAFSDGYHRFSPIISRVRYTPAQRYAVDFGMDYDTRLQTLRASSITGSAFVSNNTVALTYFNTHNLPPTQFPSNQIRAAFVHGSALRPGLNAGASLSYDFNTRKFQQSSFQVAYNWDCCGLALELREFNVGARVENQWRFTFSLKNVGSFGNLRKQERLF